MNKQEIAVVVALFMILLGWGAVQKRLAPSPQPELPAEAPVVAGTNVPAITATGPSGESPAETQPPGLVEAPAEAAPVEPPAAKVEHAEPETRIVMANEHAEVFVSSWGGAVVGVSLVGYPASLEEGDNNVYLDFSAGPALALAGIPGLTTNADFKVTLGHDGESAVAGGDSPSGLVFKRILRFDGSYRLVVEDTFSNPTESAVVMPQRTVALGPMLMTSTDAMGRKYPDLGIDTLMAEGGSRVQRWGKKLPARFGAGRGGGCGPSAPVTTMPMSVSHSLTEPLTWAAVKNKFFVQCLAPEGGFDGCNLHATRDAASSNAFVMASVSADAVFAERTLAPGESVSQEMSYFVGPKKFTELSKLAYHQDKVMLQCWRGWEWWRSACVGMLWLLNALYRFIPNYGVGIIVLTVLVRIVFWPLTHKSTQSMKKMQEIQPLVTKVREKYKDKPQKMNQEVMALYKVHKVNPMAGCLPMFIQMPVFIAMFTVLRSAVELRFAPFLWIQDLSGPERMFEFGFTIPFVGWDAFNLLPLVMTGLTLAQQRMTPAAGDPQQQKMMMFMPVFFLLFFYNMPSALVLYWSTSQALAVVQLVMQRRKKASQEATPEGKPGPTKPAPAAKKARRKK